ncbi:MAG: TIGR00159 family protein [Anaerolineaceae bacterium]|nr:TIGR00159 family protein [Anaerolineaceae bacterium]
MELFWALDNLTWKALLDIFLVGLVFFGASFFFRGTQAIALLRGLLLLLISLLVVSSVLDLQALRWLTQNLLVVMGLAIPVIFQPELRRALERLGRAGTLLNRQAPETVRARVIEEISIAAEKLSERRHGALIVLQRQSSLEEYIKTGISLNSDVTSQLLLTVFWPKTELHDGAAIIDENARMASAASVLPLTASRNLPDPKLGTRHRAALGISEVSDAICVVVSEETGRISITNAGRMIAKLDGKRLRTILGAFYGDNRDKSSNTLSQLIERGQELVAALTTRRNQV